MSDYIKITDYAAKDALLTGNPAKLVKGTEIGADFDAVAVAVATKANTASPTLVTPTLGVATATSVNKITFTQPATGATLTLVEGSTLATSGAYSTTLTATGATNVTLPTTGTLATLAGSEEFTNKTLNASVGKGTWTASGTWTLPALTLGGAVSGGSQNISGLGTLGCGAITSSGSVSGVGFSTSVSAGNSTYLTAAAGTITTLYGSADALGVGLLGTTSAHDVVIYAHNAERARFSSTGLAVTGDISVSTKTPASAAAAGVAGTITWDADYIYVCTATNTWKRVAIATWP